MVTSPRTDAEKEAVYEEDVVSTSASSTTASQEDGEDAVHDMGLVLTCSFRSGVGPRQLVLEHPPDGGTRAWLQVLGGHLTVFATWYVWIIDQSDRPAQKLNLAALQGFHQQLWRLPGVLCRCPRLDAVGN